jgi:hypothetical protein
MIRPQASSEELRLDKLEKMKQYDEKNKEKLKEMKKENSSIKIHCEACDCYHRRGEKSRHYNTQKHINNTSHLEIASKK